MNTGTDHTADYKALSILTKAMMIGILLFCLISLLLYFFGSVGKSKDDSRIVFSIILVISVTMIAATRLIYSKRIVALEETNQSSKEKLDIFRSITITHMALCEFIALLSIICFMVLGNFLFFLIVLMALIEMFMKFPTQQRIESAVNSGTF